MDAYKENEKRKAYIMKKNKNPAEELKMMITKQGTEIKRLQTIISTMERDSVAIQKVITFYAEKKSPQGFFTKHIKKLF